MKIKHLAHPTLVCSLVAALATPITPAFADSPTGPPEEQDTTGSYEFSFDFDDIDRTIDSIDWSSVTDAITGALGLGPVEPDHTPEPGPTPEPQPSPSQLTTLPPSFAPDSPESKIPGALNDIEIPETPGVAGVVHERAVERYLGYFTRNTYVAWDNSCAGYYVCGTTSLGDSQPTIHLDPSILSTYATSGGMYVLVHEAAHAQSWFLYGSIEQLISTSEQLTGIAGTAAVEYMADCATLVKLGYSLGTYTQTCTAAQKLEAAKYWK